jgi:hypothetical protein
MYHTVAVQHVKERAVMEYLPNILLKKERKERKKEIHIDKLCIIFFFNRGCPIVLWTEIQ